MKGQKFHYAETEWNPVVVKTVGALPPCHGTNGPDGVNCARQVCDGTNGPKDGEAGTPCTVEEPKTVPKYTDNPTAGSQYQTTGNLSPTSPGGHSWAGDAPYNAAHVMWSANDAPEKVSVTETKIAKSHTTFYNKK